MTALIIIGIIVLIFAFILNVRIRAEVKFYGGILDLKVKYLFFTIFPFKKKEKKIKTAKKPKKDKKPAGSEKKAVRKHSESNEDISAAEEPGDDEELSDRIHDDDENEAADDQKKKKKKKDKDKPKKSLSEKFDDLSGIIEKVKVVWEASQKGLKKLFLNIYIDDLTVDFRIAGDDAYKTALNYGRISAAVYNIIAFLSVYFRTKIKTVDVVCDFTGERSAFDGEVKVAIKPSTIFSAVFIILFGLLKNYKVLLGKTSAKPKKPENKKAVTV